MVKVIVIIIHASYLTPDTALKMLVSWPAKYLVSLFRVR